MAAAVDLQRCRSDLQNTRILATESAHAAEAASAVAARLTAQRQAPVVQPAPAPAPRNAIFTVLFAFGSAELSIPESNATRLVEESRAAPLMVLRGRTDGDTETPAESRVASERADAVRDYLIHAGVEAARIRTTYQPVGDAAADNSSADGRTLNRRVEIEIYRAAPIFEALSASRSS